MFKIIFILPLTFILLLAETTKFSVIIHKPFDAALLDITQNYDRTLTAVGFSNINKRSQNTSGVYTNAFDYLESVSGRYGVQMHLVKVNNNNANILLSKVAKLPRFNKAVSVVKTPSDGYFVGGYTLDGELIVLKLDAHANIEFTKIFGTKNYDRMNNLILLSDGGVLAVGSSFTSRDTHDDMFQTGLGANDIFITRFSKEGLILWSKKYGTKYDDRGIDAAEASDGSILVISTTAYDNARDVTLMRLTENGNRLWAKHYKSKNRTIPKKIIRLKNNNFLVSLQEFSSLGQEHIRLIEFDLYKNIIYDKKLFTTYPSTLNDIKELSNGNIVGVGYVKDSTNTDALAMLLSADLVILRQEHYGDINYDLFNALVILNNSQIGVAGIHTDKASQETNMWIVKLNEDLSIASRSIHAGRLYTALKKLFQEEIQNKQISLTQDLTITLNSPELYFDAGVSKLTEKQKKFLQTFSKKLFNFLYQYQNIIEEFQVNGHTSSEWGKLNFPQNYLNNEKLSMQRAFSVYSYLFTQQPKSIQKWLAKIIVGSGYSSSKAVYRNAREDKVQSRKVNFKIVLKPENKR